MERPRFTFSKLRDYYTLTKPEVNLLILMTTSAGYYLASRGTMSFIGLLHTLIGTLLVASGTATLNQWMERLWDAQMLRTARRPLPSGRLTASEAFVAGISLSMGGGLYLAIFTNLLSAFLAISTLLAYLLVYTPLKRKTSWCTMLGAIPGAMPTLIGWAGASGSVSAHAWFIFGLLFLWQFPHFLAIALLYREDYAKAGYKMLPNFDVDGCFTRAEIAGLSLLLVLIMMYMGLHAGPAYLIISSVAGAFFLYPVLSLAKTGSSLFARRVVHASVIYLPIVLVVTVVAKR